MIRMPTSRLRMQHFGPLSRLMTIARLAADPADLTAQDRPCCRNRRLRTEENPPWDPDDLPSTHSRISASTCRIGAESLVFPGQHQTRTGIRRG